MTSGEAKLLPYAGLAFKIEQRRISTAQLDTLEISFADPRGPTEKHGFEESAVELFPTIRRRAFGKASGDPRARVSSRPGHATDWTRKPVDAHEGELTFWDVVYVVKTHRFAKLKREGDAVRHTVTIQGAACAGSPDACVRVLPRRQSPPARPGLGVAQ